MENASNNGECDASEGATCQPDKVPTCGFPLTSECEFIYEGSSPSEEWKNCKKNPGHKKFIPVLDFKKEHLPENFQTDDVMRTIKTWIDRTVKLTIKCTSKERPDTYPHNGMSYPERNNRGWILSQRCGTGHIMETKQKCYLFRPETPCPCHLCRYSVNPKIGFYEFGVSTAAHVVFNNEEASKTEVELFYDNPDNKVGVKKLYGVRLEVDAGKMVKSYLDAVMMTCVTHDKDIIDRLSTGDDTFTNWIPTSPVGGIIISHPHGYSKHITVGNLIQYNCPLPIHFQECSHFEIGSGARFRFAENCSLDVMEFFQTFLRSSIRFKPKEEYTLKEKVILHLHPESDYTFQSKDLSVPWVTFPPGAELADGCGRICPLITNTVEFDLKSTRNIFPIQKKKRCPVSSLAEALYITYDIDTCRGSSGAQVITSPDSRFWMKHFCVLPDGTNRSGVAHRPFDSDYRFDSDIYFDGKDVCSTL